MFSFRFLFNLTLLTAYNYQSAAQSTSNNLKTNFNSHLIADTVQKLSEAIMVVYQDRNNNYWFGSRGQGVFKYFTSKDGRKYIINYTKKHGLVSSDIWGIQEDKAGNIYFDTQDGISKFDGQSFTTLKLSDASISEWKSDPDDLWFKGNWNKNGTYRYDGKTLHHLEFPKKDMADKLHKDFPNMSWSPYGLYSLFKDKKGHIWFGTSNLGIYRFDGKALTWMYEKQLTDIEETGGSFGIRSIFEDTEGKFWFCNVHYRYSILPTDTSKKIIYKKHPGIELNKDVDGINYLYYMSMIEDNDHALWMVTYSDGVYKFNPKKELKLKDKKLEQYIIKDGAKDVKLFSIYKDRQGNLWLGSHDGGAFKFNGKTFEKFKA